jgi:hypothetical protein
MKNLELPKPLTALLDSRLLRGEKPNKNKPLLYEFGDRNYQNCGQ